MMKNLMTLLSVCAAGAILLISMPARGAEGYTSAKDEADVAKLSQDWADAMAKGDTDAMEKILADTYTFVDPSGDVWSKEKEIGSYKEGDLKFESINNSEVKVRIYVGGAVVTGKTAIKGKYKKTDISGDYRYVEVYESGKSGWKVVYAQVTKIPEPK